MKRIVLSLSLAGVMLSLSSSAYAVCDGCVVAAVQAASTIISGAVSTAASGTTTALGNLLSQINTNIGGVGSKVSDSVVQAGNANREMAVETQRQQELDRIGRETELPIDPCATSGSNYVLQAVQNASSKASSYRRGGGGGGGGGKSSVSSSVLDRSLNGAAPSVEASRRASTAIHQTKYCSDVEVKLGYSGCSSSTMPDGDSNADSLFTGAGAAGKAVDLTFTPDQEEAARAYARLSLDPQPPENVTKAEANTESGKLYIAMQKAYQANITSAEKAMFDEIGSHMPFAGSAQMIQDINQSDAAAQYFNATASKVAKATGTMSLAELQDFEAGRRWRNPYWVVEMGALADPTKLAREQLFTQAFQADLQYETFQKDKHIEVLLGQILASLTRSSERPMIEAQLGRVRATNAK